MYYFWARSIVANKCRSDVNILFQYYDGDVSLLKRAVIMSELKKYLTAPKTFYQKDIAFKSKRNYILRVNIDLYKTLFENATYWSLSFFCYFIIFF